MSSDIDEAIKNLMRCCFRLAASGADGCAFDWFDRPIIELYEWCEIVVAELKTK